LHRVYPADAAAAAAADAADAAAATTIQHKSFLLD
jgi:hypothetical protein